MNLFHLLWDHFWFILTVFLIITYSIWPYIIFSAHRIPGPTPLPFVGNFISLMAKGFTASEKEWHNKYGDIYRIYEGRTPNIIVWNLDFLKNIMIKDFSSFRNRRPVPFIQPELKDNLLNLKDDRWKEVRATLTPAFSSGKLKQMMSLLTSCCLELVTSFKDVAESRKMVDASGYYGAFTLDVIASTAFGVQVNSQKNKTDPFVVCAKESFIQKIPVALLIMSFFPFLTPFLKKFFDVGVPRKSINFFKSSTQSIIDMRRSGLQMRTDFIQLMLNSHLEVSEEDDSEISNRKGLTDSEIFAQSIVFFLAGYETTGTTLSNATYLLSLHPDWQTKIFQQIESTLGNKKEITYEDLANLPYLEMVLMETLRLYPPATRVQRTCTKDYQLGPYKIYKGMILTFPVFNIHHDEKIWPNPERFDPERFSQDEKSSRHPMSFLAFGSGPRVCIGMRLALLEAKLALAYTLREFIIRPCEKTEIPLQLTNTILSRAKNGIWIQLNKRQKSDIQ